jgi:hypothetical protein
MGTSWREQDAPIPVECDNITNQLKVANEFVNFLSVSSREIAVHGVQN